MKRGLVKIVGEIEESEKWCFCGVGFVLCMWPRYAKFTCKPRRKNMQNLSWFEVGICQLVHS